MKKLLVITLTYNSQKFIEKCLTSLKNQSYSEFDLLILDNASQDKTVKSLEQHSEDPFWAKRLRVIKNDTNIGFAKAVNIGLKKTLQEDYRAVLLLNPDAVCPSDLVEKGLKLMSEKELGAWSPTIVYPSGEVWWQGTRVFSLKELLNWRRYSVSIHPNKGGIPDRSKDQFPVEAITGCSMFINTEAIKKIGLLDERFFMYCEDVDYSIRLKEAGFKIVCFTTTSVVHAIGDKRMNLSSSGLRKYKLYLASTYKFIAKHYTHLIGLLWLIKLPVALGYEVWQRKI